MEIDDKNIVAGSNYSGAGGGDEYRLIASREAVTMVPLRWSKSRRWQAEVASTLIVKIF